MNNELYCYEYCNGYQIFVTQGDDFFYSEIFLEDELVKWGKGADGEGCLTESMSWCLDN